jgi:hypothetical protein
MYEFWTFWTTDTDRTECNNQDEVLQQEQVKVKPGNPGMQSIHPSELI